MLTLVIVIYFVLSLVCTLIIYSACVIASRNNELFHTEELSNFKRSNTAEERLGRVKPTTGVTAKVSNLLSPTSSLN